MGTGNGSGNRPLRVVQLVENLDVGGLERIVVDLAIAQKRAGQSPAVVCLFHAGPLAPEAEAAGVDVVALCRPRGFSWQTLRILTSTLRGLGADVVHTHGSALHHYGVVAGRLAGVKRIVNTRHGTGFLHNRRRQELFFKAMAPFTDAFVYCCQEGQRVFTEERGLPKGKSRVILNGIPLERFPARDLPRLEAGDDPADLAVRFGTVGNLRIEKDHATLIDAFALVSRQLPRATLRIVGEGWMRNSLAAQIRVLGLEERVRLEGARMDVAPFYRELDVFVMSSRTEGLPVVILEAMAAGLPIVSTRVGGIPEVAPEGTVATYCEPGDAQALAKAMLETARSGRMRDRALEARRIAQAEFGIEQIEDQYRQLFCSLR